MLSGDEQARVMKEVADFGALYSLRIDTQLKWPVLPSEGATSPWKSLRNRVKKDAVLTLLGKFLLEATPFGQPLNVTVSAGHHWFSKYGEAPERASTALAILSMVRAGNRNSEEKSMIGSLKSIICRRSTKSKASLPVLPYRSYYAQLAQKKRKASTE